MFMNTTCSDRVERLARFRPFTVGGISLFVSLLLVVLFYYRFHFLLMYHEWRAGYSHIPAITVSDMLDSKTPDNWLTCCVGCVEFRLPPALATNRVTHGGQKDIVLFEDGTRVMLFHSPETVSAYSPFVDGASKLNPFSGRITVPELRRLCCQTSSDEFRWSMTQDEVRWYTYRLSIRLMLSMKTDKYAEWMFRQDLTGIAHYRQGHVVFFWQSEKNDMVGYIHFYYDGIKDNPAWIQAVCQSLNVSEKLRKSVPRNSTN